MQDGADISSVLKAAGARAIGGELDTKASSGNSSAYTR